MSERCRQTWSGREIPPRFDRTIRVRLRWSDYAAAGIVLFCVAGAVVSVVFAGEVVLPVGVEVAVGSNGS